MAPFSMPRKHTWVRRIFRAFFLSTLLLFTVQTAPTIARAQTIPVASIRNPDGTLNLRQGVNAALDLKGWDVGLDATLGPVLSPALGSAAPVATWSALPHKGLNQQVFTLAVMGNNIYVGGLFSQTSEGSVKNLNNIAKFSGGAWHALPHHGLNGYVLSLTVVGNNLLIGGHFTQTADGAVTNLNYIAKFDGTNWVALPHHGLNANVEAITALGNDLFVAGHFTQTADGNVTNLNNIAKLKGGIKWKALPHNGLNGGAISLAVLNQDLYVGGGFTGTSDAAVTNLGKIARLSGGAWQGLPHLGLDSFVDALTVLGNDVYVGGNFSKTADGTMNLNYVARLKGGTIWKAVPKNGLDSYVAAFGVNGTDLYIGGGFKKTADGTVTNLNHIALLKGGATWKALPNHGLNETADALTIVGKDLYVGGNFTQSADGAVTNLNNIAKLTLP